MARGLRCWAHKHRTPVSEEYHHIQPKEFHGPSIAANMVWLCSNAHGDTHVYLNWMLRHNGQRPVDWRTYNRKIRMVAEDGYKRVMQYGTELALPLDTEGRLAA
jgi:hypothetical protein